jgi:hypothetical protein
MAVESAQAQPVFPPWASMDRCAPDLSASLSADEICCRGAHDWKPEKALLAPEPARERLSGVA